MTGFPNLPLTRGETDDDASIHLYSRVGPARPIMRSKYDKQIMSILNSSRDKQENRTAGNINKQFDHFIHDDYAPDTESDATHVEEDPAEDYTAQVPKKKKYTSSAQNPTPTQILLLRTRNLVIFGFLLGAICIICFQITSKQTYIPPIATDLTQVNSRLQTVEESILILNNMSEALDNQLDLVDAKQTDFFNSLKSDYDIIQGQFHDLKANLSLDKGQFQKLLREIEDFRVTINGLELLTEAPKDLENRLSQISHKLLQLSNARTNLKDIKKEIVEDLIQKLPEHVPVYVQNNKIHYIPEFHKFLHAFVEKYGSHKAQTWTSFIKEGGEEFQTYLQDLVDSSQVDLISKAEFEKILNGKFAQISEDINSRYMDILNKVDLSRNITNVDMADAGHKIVLDNLLEVIGKGSMKLNYADYSLGARILGFLTTTGKDTSHQKSFIRSLFLGWYDYLSSNGLRAPKNLKLNANNLLFDGGEYWQCEANWCNFGIRLSSPIILTDIILNNPSAERPRGLNLPTKMSIYIKPRKKLQAMKLQEYVSLANYDVPITNNKYLSKFYKVQEVNLRGKLIVEHIQLPLSLVNMKIVVRDIFVQIESREGNIGVYNIKAYGLTEFNAYKYSQEFDSLLDKLPHGFEESEPEPWNSRHESYTMEDDDYI